MTLGPANIATLRDPEVRSDHLIVRLYDADDSELSFPQYRPQRIDLIPLTNPEHATNALEILFPSASSDHLVRYLRIYDNEVIPEAERHVIDLGETILVRAGKGFRIKKYKLFIDYSCTPPGIEGPGLALEHEVVTLDDVFEVGQEVVYGNLVGNFGGVDDSNVRVRLAYPAAQLAFVDATEPPVRTALGEVEFEKASLKKDGDKWFFGVTMKAVGAGVATTTLSKVSSATGVNVQSDSETIVIEEVETGLLTIDLRHATNPGNIFVDDVIPLEIVLSEVNGLAIENATLRFTAPGGLLPSNISDGGVSIAPETTVLWTGLNFAAGEQKIVTLDLKIGAAGVHMLLAKITGWDNSGSTQFPIQDSLIVETVNVPAVSVQLSYVPDDYDALDTIPFTLLVKNISNHDLTDVTVRHDLPLQMAYTTGSASIAPDDEDDSAGGFVEWEIASFAAGAEFEVDYDQVPQVGGQITEQAKAFTDEETWWSNIVNIVVGTALEPGCDGGFQGPQTKQVLIWAKDTSDNTGRLIKLDWPSLGPHSVINPSVSLEFLGNHISFRPAFDPEINKISLGVWDQWYFALDPDGCNPTTAIVNAGLGHRSTCAAYDPQSKLMAFGFRKTSLSGFAPFHFLVVPLSVRQAGVGWGPSTPGITNLGMLTSHFMMDSMGRAMGRTGGSGVTLGKDITKWPNGLLNPGVVIGQDFNHSLWWDSANSRVFSSDENTIVIRNDTDYGLVETIKTGGSRFGCLQFENSEDWLYYVNVGLRQLRRMKDDGTQDELVYEADLGVEIVGFSIINDDAFLS